MRKRLLILSFLLSVFCFLFLGLGYLYVFVPIQPQTLETTLSQGQPLRAIAEQLEAQGIIRNAWVFMAYATLTRQAQKLQAGDYRFKKRASTHRVLEKLAKGKVILYKVRIVEGWTVQQIAEYLKTRPFITDPHFAEEFLELAKGDEGSLLPETYYFSKRATPRDYVKTFLKAFAEFYPDHKSETVTLASLIEKETGLDEERPLIASVFYNRLAKGMALASDPTVIYGLKNFDGDLRKEDLSNPHPYNTYLHPGLPPGPICNPGRASILAALHPAQTDYLYFVSKNNGSHHFSRTLAEHNQAVRKYQPRLTSP